MNKIFQVQSVKPIQKEGDLCIATLMFNNKPHKFIRNE